MPPKKKKQTYDHALHGLPDYLPTNDPAAGIVKTTVVFSGVPLTEDHIDRLCSLLTPRAEMVRAVGGEDGYVVLACGTKARAKKLYRALCDDESKGSLINDDVFGGVCLSDEEG